MIDIKPNNTICTHLFWNNDLAALDECFFDLWNCWLCLLKSVDSVEDNVEPEFIEPPDLRRWAKEGVISNLAGILTVKIPDPKWSGQGVTFLKIKIEPIFLNISKYV